MESIIIGKDDIENLNYLAEEVLMQLRYEGYRYDDDGNDKFPYQEGNENTDARVVAMHTWMDSLKDDHPLEFRDNRKLQGISFGEALEMSYSEIKEKYLKDYLPMMRALMRNDKLCIGYSVSDEVTDDFLDDLMALRWKENLKLWTMQWGHKDSFYFLLYGNTEFHDNDEYIGIYRSNAALWNGYKKALEDYKDMLPGGKNASVYKGSSLLADDLIIYGYDYDSGSESKFKMLTPEEIWGEEQAKKLRSENSEILHK